MRRLLLLLVIFVLGAVPAYAQTTFGPVTPTAHAGSPRTDDVVSVQGCPTCSHIVIDQGLFNGGGASNAWWMQGIETAGGAVAGGGFRAMGSDGTYARDLLTDTSGRQYVDVYSLPSISGSVTSAQGAQAGAGTAATGWWWQGIETAGGLLTGGGTRAMGSNGVYSFDLPVLQSGNAITPYELTIGGSDGSYSRPMLVSTLGASIIGSTTQAVGIVPVSTGGSGATFKSSSANFYGAYLQQGSTAGYFVFLNQTTVPSSGASITSTFVACLYAAANAPPIIISKDIPDRYLAGLTIVDSTSCGTYTPINPILMTVQLQ